MTPGGLIHHLRRLPGGEESQGALSQWQGRFNAVGRLQGRLFWFTLLAMVFFPSVRTEGADGSALLFGLRLDPSYVIAGGPLVILLLIGMTCGSLRAVGYATRAAQRLGYSPNSPSHQRHDLHPNGLEMLLYIAPDSTPRVRSWLGTVFFFALPVFLYAAFLEAVILWCRQPTMGARGPIAVGLWAASLPAGALAFGGWVAFFTSRFNRWIDGEHLHC